VNAAPWWWVAFCVFAVLLGGGLFAWMLLHRDDVF